MNIETNHLLDTLSIKLKQSNEIIYSIAASEKNISPVTQDDYQLFEDFFSKEDRHTYGNSWVYVTQGVYGIGPSNLGYKYYDGKNLCMIGISPKIEPPHPLMLYWIRPLGKDMPKIIVDYTKEIKEKYGISSYVKKLFSDQYEFFIEHGFKNSQDFPWHSVSHAEDDTCPELILDSKEVLSATRTASKRSNLGRSFREVQKLLSRHNVILSDTDFETHAWKLVKLYFEDYRINKRKNFSCEWDYYNPIFQNPKRASLIRNLILVDSIPVGFYILEQQKQPNMASLYSMIVLKSPYKYLPDYTLLKIAERHNFQYINLGGSEDTGIHNFKLKYQPTNTQSMHWVTNHFFE